MQADYLVITLELLDSVSFATKRYFQSQGVTSWTKEKSSKNFQLAELNEEILKLNTKAMLLRSAISDLQKSSEKAMLDVQKKQTLAEMRNEVTK